MEPGTKTLLVRPKSWWSAGRRSSRGQSAGDHQYFLTLVFGLECLFRFGVLGRALLVCSGRQVVEPLDVTVVVFGIIDIIVDTLPGRARFKNLTLLRAIRFMKFAKTLRVAALAKPSRLKMIAGKLDYDFAGICALIVDLSGWIGATVLMLALFWFFMAIVGTAFRWACFGSSVDDNFRTWALNFDTFPMAYYTVAFSTFLIDVDLIIYEGSAGTKGFFNLFLGGNSRRAVFIRASSCSVVQSDQGLEPGSHRGLAKAMLAAYYGQSSVEASLPLCVAGGRDGSAHPLSRRSK